ncbi:hypothetical protein [Amycolatopsis coloradensis]|uniref:hypothetical protein n=1 Tax=Amycolatopsis coloradensis TaxID=76021 RepID=UPI001178613C|nr:hypothetical protein [Amycolatopsis coloradensis]
MTRPAPENPEAVIQPASPAEQAATVLSTVDATAGETVEKFAAEQNRALPEPDAGLPAEWITARDKPMPPALGWRTRGAGRSPITPGLSRWVGSTTQVSGLYPFVLPAGVPAAGVPVGVHQFTREPVGFDAGEYLRNGWATNTAVYLSGEPGTGKSTVARRIMWGLAAFGTGVLVPADTKGEHRKLVEALGGTSVTLGRGLHKINLLDPGPLGLVLDQVGEAVRDRIRQEIQARALTLAEGGLTIASGRPLDDTERLGLALAYELHGRRRPGTTPTLSDLAVILREAPEEIRAAMLAVDAAELARLLRPLLVRLHLLLRGPLAGLFDGASTFSIEPGTPGVCLDLSRLTTDAEDTAVAVAMLAAWGWSAALIDAGQALGVRRTWVQLYDEYWRVLRAGTGMVELSDQVTRLGRHLGVQSIMATHSVDDFEALPTAEDRAKARGIIARCAISICLAQPQSELDKLSRIVPMSPDEQALIRSWAAPPTWAPAQQHPGRGKLMIKPRERLGIPVTMRLPASEKPYHDTDQAWAA